MFQSLELFIGDLDVQVLEGIKHSGEFAVRYGVHGTFPMFGDAVSDACHGGDGGARRRTLW